MLKDESGKPFDFSFEEIHQYGTAYTSESYDSFSQLLDEFYSERDRIDRTRQRSSDLQKLLSNATSRISRRLNNQRAELAASPERAKVLIETRGQGGFTVIAPSAGRTQKPSASAPARQKASIITG